MKIIKGGSENTNRKILILSAVLFVLMILFLFYAIHMGNEEFVFYSWSMFLTVLLIYPLAKFFGLSFFVCFLLGINLLVHAAGGVFYYNGTRFYDLKFGFLRYDMASHFLGAFVIALLVYSLIKYHLKTERKYASIYLFFMLAFISAGYMTIVEINELIAVLFFNGARGVGDYFNNAFDLVFNMLGAIAGSLFTIFVLTNKRLKKIIFRVN